VVGTFATCDNTCELCRAGYQTSCVQREWMNPLGAQAERLRVPLADGTLVATPDLPPADLIPSLLAAAGHPVHPAGRARRLRRRRHGVELPGTELFYSHVHWRAEVRDIGEPMMNTGPSRDTGAVRRR
jgi:hypothetical protein